MPSSSLLKTITDVWHAEDMRLSHSFKQIINEFISSTAGDLQALHVQDHSCLPAWGIACPGSLTAAFDLWIFSSTTPLSCSTGSLPWPRCGIRIRLLLRQQESSVPKQLVLGKTCLIPARVFSLGKVKELVGTKKYLHMSLTAASPRRPGGCACQGQLPLRSGKRILIY